MSITGWRSRLDRRARLRARGTPSYLADRGLATALYLKQLTDSKSRCCSEGEAGVGKTEAAKALARTTNARLIRLQCYEGLDIAHAVYEWNYARQLLHIRAAQAGTVDEAELFGREFLIPPPAARRRIEVGAAGGAPDRRGRPCRRGVRGVPARAALRLPGDGARARHRSRREAAARRDPHLEPHPRAARRAQAPLPLPLDRPPVGRARDRDRTSCRASPAVPRSAWPAKLRASRPSCACSTCRSRRDSRRRSTGRGR